jgi:hypothetical protein
MNEYKDKVYFWFDVGIRRCIRRTISDDRTS